MRTAWGLARAALAWGLAAAQQLFLAPATLEIVLSLFACTCVDPRQTCSPRCTCTLE